jgi:hypothetical protein
MTKRDYDKPWITIVKEFDNEHGETFIVYQLEGAAEYFVTGDELDWEGGWQYHNGKLHNDFQLSDIEKRQLEEVIAQA